MSARRKILIAGLGAAGQRHGRNLRILLGDGVELTALRSQRTAPCLDGNLRVVAGADPAEQLGARVFGDLAEALTERPDAVVIANPSALHLGVAQAAVAAGCSLLVEKPLSHSWDGVPEFLREVKRTARTVLVGYQWRFHPLLTGLKSWLEDEPLGRLLAVRATFGEYLPGWHPYEDYRQSYAARADLGGGVLLTQIHDFDYLGWLVGWPKEVYSVGGQLSHLAIETEDVASTMLVCERDGRRIPVHVHQDYLQKPGVRGCELIAERGRVHIDLAAASLTVWNDEGRVIRQETSGGYDRNEMFLGEMSHFLACLDGTASPRVSAEEGARSLAVALAAKRSQASGRPEPVCYP